MKTGIGQQDFVDTMIEVIGYWHGRWQDPEMAESKALVYRVRRLAHRLETDLKRELAPHGTELWSWNCWRACSAPSPITGSAPER